MHVSDIKVFSLEATRPHARVPICNDPYSLELMSPDVAFPRSYYSYKSSATEQSHMLGKGSSKSKLLNLSPKNYLHTFSPRILPIVRAHNVYKPLYFPKQI